MDVGQAEADEEEDDRHLHDDDNEIEPGRFPDADVDHPRREGRDEHRREVEEGAAVNPCLVLVDPRGRDKAGRQVDPEVVEEPDCIARPPDRHRRRAEEILQDQVPADDPGQELPACRVGVGVGTPGDRDHRGVFGIAEPGKERGQTRNDQGEDQGRSRVFRRHVPRKDEDAGTDRCPDAETDELGRRQNPAQSPDPVGLLLQIGERFFSKKVHSVQAPEIFLLREALFEPWGQKRGGREVRGTALRSRFEVKSRKAIFAMPL